MLQNGEKKIIIKTDKPRNAYRLITVASVNVVSDQFFPLESANDDTNNQFDTGKEHLRVNIFRMFVRKNLNDNE